MQRRVLCPHRIVTPAAGGGWYAWVSERQPPDDAKVRDMLALPGEVHFFRGATREAAMAALEEWAADQDARWAAYYAQYAP